jgi:hypothetical protein
LITTRTHHPFYRQFLVASIPLRKLGLGFMGKFYFPMKPSLLTTTRWNLNDVEHHHGITGENHKWDGWEHLVAICGQTHYSVLLEYPPMAREFSLLSFTGVPTNGS